MNKDVVLVSCEIKTSKNGASKYCLVNFKDSASGEIFSCKCWTPDLIKNRDVGSTLRCAFTESTYLGKPTLYLNSVEVLSPDKTQAETEEKPEQVPAKNPTENPPKKLNRTAGLGRRIAGMRTENKSESGSGSNSKGNDLPPEDVIPDESVESDFVPAESIPKTPEEFKDIPIKLWENPKYKVEDGFAPLSPNEINVRSSKVDENGASFLLWSDPYDLERILNSKFGVRGWQRKYQEVSGSVYCQILIKDGDEWITKEGGTDTSLYPEKGRAHNAAFERACRSMGLSDELWTSPDIYIPAERLVIGRDSKGKTVVNSEVKVNDIEYDEYKNIIRLELRTGDRIVFAWKKKEN